jgi:hypothetical protein
MERERPTLPNNSPAATPAPDDSDREQIVERLGWTPKQRLNYLLDMLAFEERAKTRLEEIRKRSDTDPV